MSKREQQKSEAPIVRNTHRRHNRSNGRNTVPQGIATKHPTHRFELNSDGMCIGTVALVDAVPMSLMPLVK